MVVEATTAEYVACGQFVHTEAPKIEEYDPARQFTQATLPVPALYVPATHPVHGPPLAPVYPALHGQVVDAVHAVVLHVEPEFAGQLRHAPELFVAVTAEYFPAGHSVHAEAPAVSEYDPVAQSVQAPPEAPFVQVVATLNFPAAHRVQLPPLGPVYPELHVQWVLRVQ